MSGIVAVFVPLAVVLLAVALLIPHHVLTTVLVVISLLLAGFVTVAELLHTLS